MADDDNTFSEITDDSFCEAEELYGMPGITELEDDVFAMPSDFIPVLVAAYDDYDGKDKDAVPAEWSYQQPATTLRPYRPDVSPISPVSPIDIPPANFLVVDEAPPLPMLQMLRAMPPQRFAPPGFYSPVTDDEEEAEEQMEASGCGAAAGSFLHYNYQDLVNGTRFVDVCRLFVVCLSVCRHAGRECVDKRDFFHVSI